MKTRILPSYRMLIPAVMIALLVPPCHAWQAPAPYSLAAQGTQEVAFSPNAGATELVVKVIDAARQSIRLAAYSFTSKPIAEALVAAHKRGIVHCVLNAKLHDKEAEIVAQAGQTISIESAVMRSYLRCRSGRTARTARG